MRSMRLMVALAAALATAACLPVTSKTPIGASKSLGADAGLTGSWKAVLTDGKAPAWFHFLPQKDGSLTALLISGKTKEGDGGWMLFKVRTAQLSEARYINALEISEDGKAASGHLRADNIPVLYRYNGARSITLYLIDEKKAAAAVGKKIKGTIEKGEYGDIRLTADAAEQDKFFASKDGAALFTTSFAVLTKVD